MKGYSISSLTPCSISTSSVLSSFTSLETMIQCLNTLYHCHTFKQKTIICPTESKLEWLLSKLTWYWCIHHRLLLVSSGSDLVLAVWFSFPVGSCIFFCLGLLLLQVCFAPPTCWRWEETEGSEKGKESVHFHVTMHVHCHTKPTEVHKECVYYCTSGRKWRGIKNKKRSSPLQNSLNTPLLGLLQGPVLYHYPLEYPGWLAAYFHRT